MTHEFKAGDKVFIEHSPHEETIVLWADNEEQEALVKLGGQNLLISYHHLNPAPVKPTGSDLTRKLLEDGAEAVLCWVSSYDDASALGNRQLSQIVDWTGESFRTSGRGYWRFAVPVTGWTLDPDTGVMGKLP